MKREIDAFDYAEVITKTLEKHGALLTARAHGKTNTMTIGWGLLGMFWSEPYFIVFVREGRFTRKLLDESMEFSVSLPDENTDQKILRVCGTKSGRDVDKIAALSLTCLEGEAVDAPAFRELPLTIECRVMYRELMDRNLVPEEIKLKAYPEGVGSSSSGANGDYHVAYFGKILKAYIIE